MALIYAYAPDELECANIGLVGALLAQDATFELRAGEFGELSFTHPVDEYGKWKVLTDGVILKTKVPVRLAPHIKSDRHVEVVDRYRVKASATRYQRYVYYAETAAKDPKIKLEDEEGSGTGGSSGSGSGTGSGGNTAISGEFQEDGGSQSGTGSGGSGSLDIALSEMVLVDEDGGTYHVVLLGDNEVTVRGLTAKPKKGKSSMTKHKALTETGTPVTVLEDPRPGDNSYRYRVRVGEGDAKVVGYMEKDALELVQEGISVIGDATGLERVDASYAVQQQLFRIYEVETSGDADDPGTLTVHARRLVYDLLGNVCTYRVTTNKSCQQVCANILSHTLYSHPFRAHSDIGDRHVGIDVRNMNPLAALIDPDEGVVGRWGGQVICDDYDIYVLRQAGMDRGVEISYGKNLQGVRCQVNTERVATAIRPVGEKANGEPLLLDGVLVTTNTTSGVEKRYRYNQEPNALGVPEPQSTLPAGYRFATDDDGSLIPTVITRRGTDDGYAVPKTAVLRVPDAKVSKKRKETDPNETSVLTVNKARIMLVEEAVARLEAGCDAPEVSMEVDFTLLGDTEEYAQYRHLEPLFVYDTVHIRHPRLRVRADIQLTSIVWKVREERVAKATFGALGDAVARIPGWQLPSDISGQKLRLGSVGGGQLEAEAISLNHLQADSVNAKVIQAEAVTTEKLQAQAVTADKIAAGAITAEKLAAGTVEAKTLSAVNAAIQALDSEHAAVGELSAAIAEVNRLSVERGNIDWARILTLNAETIDAGRLSALNAAIRTLDAEHATAQTLEAAVAALAVLTAGTASFDAATVRHLVANAMNLEYGEAGTVFIRNLSVLYGQMVSAAIGNLCLKASDGQYYAIDVNGDGTVTATRATVTDGEIAAGETEGGRVILETDIAAERMSTGDLLATYALVNRIDAARIDVDQLFARQAFVDKLNTNVIQGNQYIELSVADRVEEAVKDAAPAVLSITSSNGTIFKNSGIETVLTAHVYRGGTEVTGAALTALGAVKWYKDGGSTAVGTGQTLNISAGDVTNKATFVAQLEG